jgi:hypothetical protein
MPADDAGREALWDWWKMEWTGKVVNLVWQKKKKKSGVGCSLFGNWKLWWEVKMPGRQAQGTDRLDPVAEGRQPCNPTSIAGSDVRGGLPRRAQASDPQH